MKAARPRGARVAPVRVRLPVAPVRQQRPHTCGAAALRAASQAVGGRVASEAALVAAMRFGRAGSDPVHLRRGARWLGLTVREVRGLPGGELRAALAAGHPVLLAIQAWADPPPPAWSRHWSDGHWVVAVGFDRHRVYLVDPWPRTGTTSLTWRQLAARWHDVEGRAARPLRRYGLVVTGVVTGSGQRRLAGRRRA
ncbi:MAG: C39 family peptidase [Kofleriaceae bacterium]|nr:C39 family peptidase [Kofleriaceae bacterium]